MEYFFQKRFLKIRILYQFIFFLFPISQLLMFNYILDYTGKGSGIYTLYQLLGIVVSIPADMILLYELLTQGERELLKEQILESERTIELEKIHTEESEKHQKEIIEFSKEFNDKICLIKEKIELEQENDTKEIFKGLTEKLKRTKQLDYCGDSIINSILTEKEKEANKKLSN